MGKEIREKEAMNREREDKRKKKKMIRANNLNEGRHVNGLGIIN